MNILIVHPDLALDGGISHYIAKLRGKFSVRVQHLVAGRRRGERRGFSNIPRLVSDYRTFRRTLRSDRFDVVHLNPSLEPKMVLRESLYVWLAKRHGLKVVVFWHAWSPRLERLIDGRFGSLFRRAYRRADAFVVLAEAFEAALRRWGFTQPIVREVTVVDEQSLREFEPDECLAARQLSPRWRILFLARIVRDKGIYETIDAFAHLRRKHPRLELVIAGKGSDDHRAAAYVRENGIPDVIFAGYCVGAEKTRLLRESHVMCLPTRFIEGLPNTVIEAMAFGLPVVTREIAGIADLFHRTKAGLVTLDTDAESIARMIETLYLDAELYREISLSNVDYARRHFLATDAVRRLEALYDSTLRRTDLH